VAVARRALARVILKDPRILVLDEGRQPLLDRSTRSGARSRRRSKASDGRAHQRIVIAHRHKVPSWLLILILAMDRGQIVRRSTHEGTDRARQQPGNAHLYEAVQAQSRLGAHFPQNRSRGRFLRSYKKITDVWARNSLYAVRECIALGNNVFRAAQE